MHRRSKENVERLLELLTELDAVFRDDLRLLKPNESHLTGRGHVLLSTKFGQLDVLGEIREQGFEELQPYAEPMNLGEHSKPRS